MTLLSLGCVLGNRSIRSSGRVFWKGNLQRTWRVESIRSDRGCAKAMVCDPEPGLVVQHREYEISGLVLAELSDENVPPEPTIEEVLEE